MRKNFRLYSCCFFLYFFSLFFVNWKGKRAEIIPWAWKKILPIPLCFSKRSTNISLPWIRQISYFIIRFMSLRGWILSGFSDLNRAAAHIDTLNKVISASSDHGIRPEYFDMKGAVDYAAVLDFKTGLCSTCSSQIMLTDVYFKYCRVW